MISQSQTDSSQKKGQKGFFYVSKNNKTDVPDLRDLPHSFPAEEELCTDLFLLGIASWLGVL